MGMMGMYTHKKTQGGRRYVTNFLNLKMAASDIVTTWQHFFALGTCVQVYMLWLSL